MKAGLHPEYVECHVTCGCGETFVTRATVPQIRVEVCSKCHPFYTGQQKLMDSTGRIERFQKRWGAHMDARRAAMGIGDDAEPAAEAQPEADAEQEPEPADEAEPEAPAEPEAEAPAEDASEDE